MLWCVCVCVLGQWVGRDMFGTWPASGYGEGVSPPPSLAAALSLQDTLFPDVGGTSALLSGMERK